jgi:hypothetical protein
VLIQGGDKPVHFPVLRRVRDQFVVSWMEIPRTGASIAHAAYGKILGATRPTVQLDSAITVDSSAEWLMQPMPDEASKPHTQWWLTNHVAIRGDSSVHELALSSVRGGVDHVAARSTAQFAGFVSAAVFMDSAQRVLVVGAHLDQTSDGQPVLSTQVVQFDLGCR